MIKDIGYRQKILNSGKIIKSYWNSMFKFPTKLENI